LLGACDRGGENDERQEDTSRAQGSIRQDGTSGCRGVGGGEGLVWAVGKWMSR
jgi:hypothetical protein